MEKFINKIEALDNETLLKKFNASQREQEESFLNTKWREEVLPYVEAIRNEVLKRMGGRK